MTPQFLVILGLICLFVVRSSSEYSTSEVIVKTTSGVLIGSKVERELPTTIFIDESIASHKHTVNQYLGVPYAVPPVEDLRFRHPIEFLSEKEIDATKFRNACMQPRHMEELTYHFLKPNSVNYSEDCLYLNVYQPDDIENEEEKLPIVVYLPGEGYAFADPQQYDGTYMAVAAKVIFITVNYRLSVFGFLAGPIGNDVAPGNSGLYDQRLALKWVKKNAEVFGGDPNRITLMGRFTGAMSASIHAFSPLSKSENLFERMILMSGVPVGEWVYEKYPVNNTLMLAAASHCDESFEINEVLNCLKSMSASDLLKNSLPLSTRFRPSIDGNLITSHVLDAAASGDYAQVDVIIGTCKDEGTLCVIGLQAMKDPLFKKLDSGDLEKEDLDELIRKELEFFYKTDDPLLNNLVKFAYYKESKTAGRIFVDFCGDMLVTSNAQRLADILTAKKSNVFKYEFTHRPTFSVYPRFYSSAHGDDVVFATGVTLASKDLRQDEINLTTRMTENFGNFAKYGNPSQSSWGFHWPTYTLDKREVMYFGGYLEKDGIYTSIDHETASEFFHDIMPLAAKKSCRNQTA